MTLARQLLSKMRTIRIGRLSVSWTEQPKRLDPVRIRSPYLGAYDVVELTHEAVVLEAGVRVDQVLRVQGYHRIVADSRFYSNDFYRSAIAKDVASIERSA